MRQPWNCPKCGRELRIANQEHVCGLYDLEPHFKNRDPIGQVAFDWVCDQIDPLGEYNVMPMKTFIALANGVNFAFVKTKKRGVEISLVLETIPAGSRFQLVTIYSRTKSIYKMTALDPSDLDEGLNELLQSAYLITQVKG
jgi:hypothetical protein